MENNPFALPGHFYKGNLHTHSTNSDGRLPPEEVIAFACDLHGADRPPLVPFDQAELSPMAQSFYRDNKRVSNRRIKEELGVSLAYPDYRLGLRALLEADA